MLKIRNLLAIGIAVFMLVAVMIPFVSAQPALQTTDTPTPAATVESTATPEATATTEATATEAAATATPLATTATTTTEATPAGTPSTLPRTGGSDDGSLLVSLVLLALAAGLVLGGLGMALSRRAR